MSYAELSLERQDWEQDRIAKNQAVAPKTGIAP